MIILLKVISAHESSFLSELLITLLVLISPFFITKDMMIRIAPALSSTSGFSSKSIQPRVFCTILCKKGKELFFGFDDFS